MADTKVKQGTRSKVKLVGVGDSPPAPAAAPNFLASLAQLFGLPTGDPTIGGSSGFNPQGTPPFFDPGMMAGATNPPADADAAQQPMLPTVGAADQADTQAVEQDRATAPPPAPPAPETAPPAPEFPTAPAPTSASPPQLVQRNGVSSEAPQEGMPQSGKHALDLLSLAGILPLLAGKYGAELIPSIAGNAIAGDQAYTNTQDAKVRQAASDVLATKKANATIELSNRKQALDEQKAAQAVVDATRTYTLDLDQFQHKESQDQITTQAERVRTGKTYQDLMLKMTPDSQKKFFAGLDPDFRDSYGITLPEGGYESQDPNTKTETEMAYTRLKELGGQILSPQSTRLAPEQQVALIRSYNAAALKVGETPLPEKPLRSMSPKEQAELGAKLSGQGETRRHDKAMEANAARNAEVAAENARLRAEEIKIRKAAVGASKTNPMTQYMQVSRYLLDLQQQKAKLTQGGRDMMGEYIPPSPEQLQANQQQLQWIDQQMQTYQPIADSYKGALSVPGASGSPAGPVSQGATPAGAPPALDQTVATMSAVAQELARRKGAAR